MHDEYIQFLINVCNHDYKESLHNMIIVITLIKMSQTKIVMN